MRENRLAGGPTGRPSAFPAADSQVAVWYHHLYQMLEAPMPVSMTDFGIDRLSREERLALVQEIWDSVAAEGESLLTDAQRRELERRADEDDGDPQDGIPWEDVKAAARERFCK
jgi:putative addiction module component (TIGR02574 family)